MFSSEEESKNNPATHQVSSQALDVDPVLQLSYSQKVPELSIGIFSEEYSLTSAHPLFGPSLRCHWRVQEGVGGGRDHVLFPDNCEFYLLHLAFRVHQNKLFTKMNVKCNKGPRSLYLRTRRLNSALSDYTLCVCGACPLQCVIVSCFRLI